jgi:hypothetical protein
MARSVLQSTEVFFVSASSQLLDAAMSEGFRTINPAKDAPVAHSCSARLRDGPNSAAAEIGHHGRQDTNH